MTYPEAVETLRALIDKKNWEMTRDAMEIWRMGYEVDMSHRMAELQVLKDRLKTLEQSRKEC